MMMDPLVLTHSRKVWGQGLRPLESSYFETIHLSCYNLDICKDNYFSSSVLPFFPRVVAPLSLATIADSIMVEVEDLNHYGVGLFDFCVGNIDFLARPYGLARRGRGQWRSDLCNSSGVHTNTINKIDTDLLYWKCCF